jgi:signal transduction histidine kinase
MILIPVFRSLLGLTLTLTMIHALEIFDLEVDRKLNEMEETEILAVERERLGRDLHDRSLQSVYAAGLVLKATMEKLHLPQDKTVLGGLDQAIQALDQAVNDIRQHIIELRAQPTGLSLTEGLTKLLRDNALSSMAETDLTLDLPEDPPLSTSQVGHLLTVAREALSNVARHAHARHVQLSAQIKAEHLYLAVTDDGRGLPIDYVAGYGLRNIRDRARLLGGDLDIYSKPGRGTRLQLTIPWEQSNGKNYYFSG